METAMIERGASPRRLLWASISRAAERARSPPLDDSDLFEEETESLPRYLKGLPGCRNHKKSTITPLAQSPRNIVWPCLTSVPNVIAEMVTAAHNKLLLETLMFRTCQNGIDYSNGNAETIIGSDGLMSASVHASSRCLHVQLHGMEVLQRYFVSVDVQIYEETNGSSDDVWAHWEAALLSHDLADQRRAVRHAEEAARVQGLEPVTQAGVLMPHPAQIVGHLE
ncbi:uncharacterized protein [Dermacentor albipictus]|uniref:uncharacterized protein n=1 Tax=Dermacentor albipictus TaxID=60249 RepID=UPI0038FC8530